MPRASSEDSPNARHATQGYNPKKRGLAKELFSIEDGTSNVTGNTNPGNYGLNNPHARASAIVPEYSAPGNFAARAANAEEGPFGPRNYAGHASITEHGNSGYGSFTGHGNDNATGISGIGRATINNPPSRVEPGAYGLGKPHGRTSIDGPSVASIGPSRARDLGYYQIQQPAPHGPAGQMRVIAQTMSGPNASVPRVLRAASRGGVPS